jgi:hypothetical protein
VCYVTPLLRLKWLFSEELNYRGWWQQKRYKGGRDITVGLLEDGISSSTSKDPKLNRVFLAKLSEFS